LGTIPGCHTGGTLSAKYIIFTIEHEFGKTPQGCNTTLVVWLCFL
jgi:hypothetical protein